MNNKSADFEIYMKIIENIQRQDEWRANLEWKVNISIWTMMLALGAFLVIQPVVVPLWVGLMAPFPVVFFMYFGSRGIIQQEKSRVISKTIGWKK